MAADSKDSQRYGLVPLAAVASWTAGWAALVLEAYLASRAHLTEGEEGARVTDPLRASTVRDALGWDLRRFQRARDELLTGERLRRLDASRGARASCRYVLAASTGAACRYPVWALSRLPEHRLRAAQVYGYLAHLAQADGYTLQVGGATVAARLGWRAADARRAVSNEVKVLEEVGLVQRAPGRRYWIQPTEVQCTAGDPPNVPLGTPPMYRWGPPNVPLGTPQCTAGDPPMYRWGPPITDHLTDTLVGPLLTDRPPPSPGAPAGGSPPGTPEAGTSGWVSGEAIPASPPPASPERLLAQVQALPGWSGRPGPTLRALEALAAAHGPTAAAEVAARLDAARRASKPGPALNALLRDLRPWADIASERLAFSVARLDEAATRSTCPRCAQEGDLAGFDVEAKRCCRCARGRRRALRMFTAQQREDESRRLKVQAAAPPAPEVAAVLGRIGSTALTGFGLAVPPTAANTPPAASEAEMREVLRGTPATFREMLQMAIKLDGLPVDLPSAWRHAWRISRSTVTEGLAAVRARSDATGCIHA